MKRLEGLAKLTGAERFIDDLPLDGALWGMTVRSPAPRGRITEIRFGAGVDWSQIVVVDHRDIPGLNEIAMIENDQPVLAADQVRHVHEPVLLLAHASRDVVRRAVRAVEVVVERDDAVLDYRLAPTETQIQHGPDNVLKSVAITKGDVEHALAAAHHVVENVYETGAQEHVYLEPQGMAAWVDGDQVVVTGSLQCPYYVVNALTHALGRSIDEVRVIQTATGGGFGGKEEYPSNLAVHVALLAMKAGRPVKMIYDRGEDMAATTKRHPARVRHRTGLDRDGRLVAMDIEVLLDGGAYVTLSPVVLSRSVIHAAGAYACDDIRIRGRAVLTNSVPYGAFRGFGAPQSQFALERHMDFIASETGLDRFELRRRNLLRDGQSTSTGQVIDDGVDRCGVMDTAIAIADVDGKRSAHRGLAESHPYLRRGVGIATFCHGAGFTGSGEVHLSSVVRVSATADGVVEVLTSNTEMGQGTLTVFTQMAAERLGVDPERVAIVPADTARVPNSGPTVASRTVMVVGRLIERAIDAMYDTLGLDHAARGDAVVASIVRWHREHHGRALGGEARYEPPPGVAWDERTYRGNAYAAFAWATHVAEVEVDLRTCGVRVVDFVAVQEIGNVINETLARGQVQGGVVQSIGWALMEECRWNEGALWNAQLTNYIIPTSDDVPPIRVHFIEHEAPEGARGAKGLGELPADGPAPAILNAVADALGVQPTTIPLTPERLMEQLHAAG